MKEKKSRKEDKKASTYSNQPHPNVTATHGSNSSSTK
jgi:hypothetical protein